MIFIILFIKGWEIFSRGGDLRKAMELSTSSMCQSLEQFFLEKKKISTNKFTEKNLSQTSTLIRPIPHEVWELMLKCWEFEPKMRPTFEEICEEIQKIKSGFFRVNVKKKI